MRRYYTPIDLSWSVANGRRQRRRLTFKAARLGRAYIVMYECSSCGSSGLSDSMSSLVPNSFHFARAVAT